MANRPETEFDVPQALVRTLLDAQFPGLSALELQPLSRGWDNTNLRLGDSLIVRVPHRQAAAELILSEQRWLPYLAPQIGLAIPAPTHAGCPGSGFPWHWSVIPYAAGTEAASAESIDAPASAESLGIFLRQVHVAAPADAPLNPYRGCPLTDRRESFTRNLAAAPSSLDKAAVARIFDQAALVTPSTERVWLHGDLHTRNMIVDNGRLSSVIDWGDICAGDPATDLAGAFMLVPNDVDIVGRHAGATEADWQRARGWAIHFGVLYLVHSDDDPVMGAMGRRLIEALLQG